VCGHWGTQRQETYNHNNRLQPVRIQLGTSGTHNANSCLVYNYYSGVANPTSCAIPSQASSGNDQSVVGHYFQDTTNSSLGHTATYTYDTLMRLSTSVATGSATHSLTFSCDRYGNMTCVVNAQTNGLCPQWTFDTATNRISSAGFTYDAAGNLTADGTGAGTHTYQWDAENRMTSIDAGSTASYTYNALGQRVEKKVGSTYTEFMFDASREPVGGHNRTSWSVSVVRFGSRHLAHYQGGATYFLHGNSLGSTSQATDYSGAMTQDQLFYPWGQEWNMVGTAHEKRFASLQHRDTTETGLDPTQFRMFSSTQGRWFSTDPARGCGHNAQKLNRYAYVGNSPTNGTDPRGDYYCDFFGCYCDWFDPFCGYYYYP
jgi:RHS repeat-associated protein